MMNERISQFDDYVAEANFNKESLEQGINYLTGLKERLTGVTTVQEVIYQMDKFAKEHSVPQEIIDLLNLAIKDMNADTDVYSACNQVISLLEKMVGEREKDDKKSSDSVEELQEYVVLETEEKLNDVGVKISGDFGVLEEQISSEDDIERLRNNIDRVVEYLKEREDMLGENQTDVTLTTDQIMEATNSSEDDVILNEALNEEELQQRVDSMDNFEIDATGAIVIGATLTSPESLSFVKMMALGLMTSEADPLLAESVFGLKMIKKEENENEFQVKFGNFAKKGKENFYLDPKVTQKVVELAESFDPNSLVKYTEMLLNSSPELALMFQIFEKGVLGKKGAAQVVASTSGSSYNVGFALGNDYKDLAATFYTNGADSAKSGFDTYVCTAKESIPGNTLQVLNATTEMLGLPSLDIPPVYENEVLDQNQNLGQDPQAVQIQKSNQLVKTLGTYPTSDQSGNVSSLVLIGVAVCEVVALLTAFLLLR